MTFKGISMSFGVSLVVLLLFLTVGEGAWAESISVDAYRIRIQESLALLEEKEGQMQPEEIAWLQERFSPDLMVRDVGGELLSADSKDLLRWAEKAANSARGRDRLAIYLKALMRQVSLETTNISLEGSNWQESRSLLDEVYRGREFKYLRKRKEPVWRESVRKLLEAFGNWLEDHLGFIGGIQGRWFRYAVYGLVFLLGAILIIWIFRSFGPVGWRWKFPRASYSPSTKAFLERDWGSWRQEAHRKAREGAFREAIRFLFISVLVEGHQKGWWIYEQETTNREHLARVEGQVERREALQRLIDLYERAWYGLTRPGKEEFKNCEQLVRQMEMKA